MLIDMTAMLLTFKLALITVLILLILGIPLAWLISQYKGRFKPIIEAIVALPLVLPPTVLGFYLLIAFSPDAFLGSLWISIVQEQFVFSFAGILVGSIIYSTPFVLQPLIAAFEQQGEQCLLTTKTLGIPLYKGVLIFLLPTIRPAIITAFTLGFAHTLGEFGLILMIGGNIPGETQVVSIALFNYVETLDYQSAHILSGILLITSFIILSLLFKFNKQSFSLTSYELKNKVRANKKGLENE